MGKKEIEDFQAEVADQADQAAEAELEGIMVSEEEAAGVFDQAPPASAEFQQAATMAAGMIGAAICAAAGVKPLEEEESDKLGGAIAEVARHYPGLVISDKAAAWFGLGAVSLSIAMPRIQEYQANKPPLGGSTARQEGEKLEEGPEGDPGHAAPLEAEQSPYKQ